MNESAVRPLLAYDGECGFCKSWIARWAPDLEGRVELRPYQDVAHEHPEIPLERFASAIHYFDGRGGVCSGAAAVLRALALVPGKAWMWSLYRHVPGARAVMEAVYRSIARHRDLAARVVYVCAGRDLSVPTYRRTRRVFLVLLACTYLAAFGSLWTQSAGLIGSRGILPAEELVLRARTALGPAGFLELPTVLWWNASDRALDAACAAGIAFALVLAAGFAPRIALSALWILYLSLVSVGGVFLGYQWDALLCETGLLAVFFAPRGLRPDWRRAPTSKGALFLLRWLFFRLVFLSGAVKVASGDPSWADLSALEYHYWTQPLPHRISAWVAALPHWFHQGSAGAMFAIELGVPWLIFAPRRLRTFACAAIASLMLLITGTGNYGFFTLLALCLCVLLLDDRALARLVPARLRPRAPAPARAGTPRAAFVRWSIALGVGAVFVWTLSLLALRLRWIDRPPAFCAAVDARLRPFRSFNAYGLFAVMTTERPEIVVEGSTDGRDWKPYVFRWKPVDPARPPRFAGVHMPRLDWQMWFAALGEWRGQRWYLAFVERLLEGSPSVLALLAENPFPDGPPRRVRSTSFRYRFGTPAERAQGIWWQRDLVGPYCPTLELRDGELAVAH